MTKVQSGHQLADSLTERKPGILGRRIPPGKLTPSKPVRLTGTNCLPEVPEQPLVERQIVPRDQNRAQHFPSHEEVSQIRQTELPADRTVALRIKR